MAEGLTVESYLDTGDRDNFEAGGTGLRLFADSQRAHLALYETAMVWETRGVAAVGDHRQGIGNGAAAGRCAGACKGPDH